MRISTSNPDLALHPRQRAHDEGGSIEIMASLLLFVHEHLELLRAFHDSHNHVECMQNFVELSFIPML